jgi:hypothetical protein
VGDRTYSGRRVARMRWLYRRRDALFGCALGMTSFAAPSTRFKAARCRRIITEYGFPLSPLQPPGGRFSLPLRVGLY